MKGYLREDGSRRLTCPLSRTTLLSTTRATLRLSCWCLRASSSNRSSRPNSTRSLCTRSTPTRVSRRGTERCTCLANVTDHVTLWQSSSKPAFSRAIGLGRMLARRLRNHHFSTRWRTFSFFLPRHELSKLVFAMGPSFFCIPSWLTTTLYRFTSTTLSLYTRTLVLAHTHIHIML